MADGTDFDERLGALPAPGGKLRRWRIGEASG